MSMPFLFSSFMIPLFGKIIDRYGKRAQLLALSAGLGLATFILFMFTSPLLPLILLGFSYSLFAAIIWPSIAIVVSQEILVILT